MVAWHNDPNLKAEAVALMAEHRAQDDFIRGTYIFFDPHRGGYRGCFYGCLITDKLAAERGMTPTDFARNSRNRSFDWHSEGERIWGIPKMLGKVLDGMFERLPSIEQAAAFAVSTVEAIPVGADLSLVVSRFRLDVLADDERGVRRHTANGSAQQVAVDTVVALYQRQLVGDEPSRQEWAVAQRAARQAGDVAAAAAAAADGADGAAYDTAYDTAAAAAADADAAYAAGVAYNDADVAYARSSHWDWMVERLLHHLRTAPVPTAAAP